MIRTEPAGSTALSSILNWIAEGRFVIPDFQREFDWEPSDIRDLLRSIFSDYYIGNLLLWKGTAANYSALSCESIYGVEDSSTKDYIVLDGQQRLSALNYAFRSPDISLPSRKRSYFFYILLDNWGDDSSEEAFHHEVLTRDWARILASPQLQFEKKILPISFLSEDETRIEWFRECKEYWVKRKVELQEESEDSIDTSAIDNNIEKVEALRIWVKKVLNEYKISYIILDQEISISKVCDIFTQINSKGVKLDIFDLLNAMMTPKGVKLKEMWRQEKARAETIGDKTLVLSDFDKGNMHIQLLQAISIRKQDYCSSKYLYFIVPTVEKQVKAVDGKLARVTLIEDSEEFVKQWSETASQMRKSIKILTNVREYGVIDKRFMPYNSILPVFSVLNLFMENLPAEKRSEANTKIRKWYWASVFTEQYSGATESTSARDYREVIEWIVNNKEPATIASFSERIDNIDLKSRRSNSSSIYNGVFNLIFVNGARDWWTNQLLENEQIDDHHIVPESWFKNLKVSDNAFNSILNRTPITLETNQNIISSQLPNVYIKNIMNELGAHEARSRLSSHFLSNRAIDILLRENFSYRDFEEFIEERQKTIVASIKKLLIEGEIDQDPDVRDLRLKIENLELQLRETIAIKLEDSIRELGSNLLDNANRKIKTAIKLNPELEKTNFDSFKELSEFLDLRELEDVIKSDKLWPRFNTMFIAKETLALRFNQIAGVRNAFAHLREVSTINKHDALAALSWFNAALDKG